MITGDSVGLEEEIAGLNVYPNPSNGIVNIELEGNQTFLVQVIDVVGKLISEENINSNTTLNLQDLERGVYFITVSDSETSQTTKVIIE